MRTPDLDALTAGLSGGNQQKLVLAKWLAARCRVLILDEPTRGVDVGAKAEIHALIGRLAAEGTGVLLISSELPELVALSTRILVLRDGRLVGELARARSRSGVAVANDGRSGSGRPTPAFLILAIRRSVLYTPLGLDFVVFAAILRYVSARFPDRFARAKSHPDMSQGSLQHDRDADTVPPKLKVGQELKNNSEGVP